MQGINQQQWAALRQSKQCWDCKHNEVSDLCANCLSTTCIFEKSDGFIGEFKPNFERGLHCMRLEYRGEAYNVDGCVFLNAVGDDNKAGRLIDIEFVEVEDE